MWFRFVVFRCGLITAVDLPIFFKITSHAPGARPTNDIYIEFVEIQCNFVMLLFMIYFLNEILHTSRQ